MRDVGAYFDTVAWGGALSFTILWRTCRDAAYLLCARVAICTSLSDVAYLLCARVTICTSLSDAAYLLCARVAICTSLSDAAYLLYDRVAICTSLSDAAYLLYARVAICTSLSKTFFHVMCKYQCPSDWLTTLQSFCIFNTQTSPQWTCILKGGFQYNSKEFPGHDYTYIVYM